MPDENETNNIPPEVANNVNEIEPDITSVNNQEQTVQPQSPPAVEQPIQDAFSPNESALRPENKQRPVGVIIAAAVAVLLVGGGASAYNFWYQNPDKVIADSVMNLLHAESFGYDSQGTIDADDIAVEFTASGVMSIGSGSKINAQADIETEDGKTFTIEGASVVDRDFETFIQIQNAVEMYGVLLGAEDAGFYAPVVEFIDGQWIHLTADGEEVMTEARECVQGVLADIRNDDELLDEIGEVFKENRFLVVDETLGSENGNLGYRLVPDRDNARSFGEAIEETELFRRVEACDDSSDDLLFDSERSVGGSENSSVGEPTASGHLDLWISRWSHQIQSMEIVVEDGGSTMNISVTMDYDAEDTVETPTDTMTVEEVIEVIEARLFQSIEEAYEPYEPDNMIFEDDAVIFEGVEVESR